MGAFSFLATDSSHTIAKYSEILPFFTSAAPAPQGEASKTTASSDGASASGKIGYPIKDFYLTNPIARASAVMQQCSSELLGSGELAEAAE